MGSGSDLQEIVCVCGNEGFKENGISFFPKDVTERLP